MRPKKTKKSNWRSIKEIRQYMTTVQKPMTRSAEDIRKDFPILSRQVHGKPLVYLDSTASSQKPLAVIEAMSAYYQTTHANVHRGVYELSEEATAKMERARVKVARFINARQSKQVIFTRNTTESINLVAYSWGMTNIQAGDLIVLTEMEHHSNLVPWQLLAQRAGARLEFVPVTADGLLRLDVYEQLLQQQPKLVAFAHMSNVLGTVNPAREMIAQAHAAGALVLLDAAQSVPHMPVDVQALDVDFLCFSGHKLPGPTGIGVLYGKRDLLEAMPPFMGGGDMIRTVGLRESTWNDLPWKFEAGTPAIAEAIGLGAAVDYLNAIGMENVHQHEQAITAYAMEQLQHVPGLTIYGPGPAQRGGVISFTLADIHPHDLASILDQEVGVAIRAGHHCAQPLMERFGLSATARASFYVYTTTDDVDTLVKGLHKALEIFNL
jgi:cysteine desulfurase / selenocysteine lyase